MSTQVNRETLELEKLREELLTELSRRHNWQQQERNWEEQASYWRWQNRLLLGTFILGVLGLILRVWP